MDKAAYEERLKSTGRNEPCPCGSGRKYKQCHMSEDEASRHAAMKKAEEERQASLAAEAEAENEDGKSDEAGGAQRKRGPSAQDRMVGGKGRSGSDRHTNVPRRGAV